MPIQVQRKNFVLGNVKVKIILEIQIKEFSKTGKQVEVVSILDDGLVKTLAERITTALQG